MLAGKLDLSPEDMFTCGLLHDLGRLIMAIYAPEEFRAVEKLMAEERMTSSGAEMQLLGLDHGLIGAMSLASWNLPQRLTEPINWHHSPDSGPGFAREASLVFIADAAAHKFENPAYRVDRNWREKMADFGLDEEEIVVELKGLSSDDRLDSLLSALGV
jgi:HD-like signal output (HDOD) protein